MLDDLRFAFRQLSKHRGLAAVAILTLALGIGANTAIFSLVDSVWLEPLPYPDAGRLVGIFEQTTTGGLNSVSGGAFKDWQEHGTHFDQLAIFEAIDRNLTGGGAPEHIDGLAVSSEFIPALGVDMAMGRGFAADADRPGGASQVVVLSHGLWTRRFGASDQIVGTSVVLDQVPHTVVGVLPPDAMLSDTAEFLVPTVIDGDPDLWYRAGHWRSVIGRLADGATIDGAQTELQAIKQRLTAEYPPFKEDWTVRVLPLQDAYAGNTKPTFALLFGAVALVLLIACVNVSNLLLARGQARSREMAIRTALGAARWRIVRQMLVESLILALAGGGLGLLVAMYGIDFLAGRIAGELPRALHPELDGSVLLFTALTACGCGLLFGILPALRAGRRDPQHGLRATERGGTSVAERRAQTWLVAAELAFTLVLLVGAGLLLRSFVEVLDTDPGFTTESALAFDLTFPAAKYPEARDRLAITDRVVERIQALPGVEHVGASAFLPLSRTGHTDFASRGDRPESNDYLVSVNFVSDEFFTSMGIPIERGRGFTSEDRRLLPAEDTGVDAAPTLPRTLIVDRQLVDDLFPDGDALDARLRFGDFADWQIVGIAAPIRQRALDHPPMPTIYIHQGHSPYSTSLIVRTAVPPTGLTEAVRKAILTVDPDQPITNVRTFDEALAASLANRRTTLILLAIFALVAVGLACLGIYGMMSYAVGQRHHELCIRSALGADRRTIRGLVLRSGLATSVVGIAIGSVAAWLLASFLERLLYQVDGRDPLVFVGSIGLLLAVTTLSILWPARRAARADPSQALRSE